MNASDTFRLDQVGLDQVGSSRIRVNRSSPEVRLAPCIDDTKHAPYVRARVLLRREIYPPRSYRVVKRLYTMGARDYSTPRYELAPHSEGRPRGGRWRLCPQIGYTTASLVPPVTWHLSLSHKEKGMDMNTLNRRMPLM